MADNALSSQRLHDVPDQLTTADGIPLKRKLAISMRRARWRAFLMTAPLVLFMLVSFVLPIGQMLTRSVYNDSFSKALPNFSQALRNWDQKAASDGLPDEALFKLCLLYTSPSPRDLSTSRMPSSA